MNQVETDQEKIARLEHDLSECYKLTGADPDGNEDWRLAAYARDEVRRFRQEFDELASRNEDYAKGNLNALRDLFAGEALAGLSSHEKTMDDVPRIAERAYALADAMLRARGK